MDNVYIIEAVRSPIGKRGKGLAGLMPADLLGQVQSAAINRSGIPPEKVGQVIGGCVSQVGEQTFNIARIAWLSQGLPEDIAATTIDSQCGSSQQATSMGAAMVSCGMEDIVMCCGVEMMSRVPLGSAMKEGSPMGESYFSHYQPTSQFQGAAMIAEEYQISRADTDRFGLRSQERAKRAQQEGRFTREITPIMAPVLDAEGQPTGKTQEISVDEGIRETTLDALTGLKLVQDKTFILQAPVRRYPTAPLLSYSLIKKPLMNWGSSPVQKFLHQRWSAVTLKLCSKDRYPQAIKFWDKPDCP